MHIDIPELSLVILIDPTGSGKSSFAQRHFQAGEMLGEESLEERLRGRRFTVIDATLATPEERREYLRLAREYHFPKCALLLDVPPCPVKEKHLLREGWRKVHVLSPEDIEAVSFGRRRLGLNKRHDSGPFDIIGDVHGCYDELIELLEKLGYRPDDSSVHAHPEGRKAVFVGDLVDRGPRTPEVLRLVMRMYRVKRARCVMGNHDDKLLRKLKHGKGGVSEALAASLEQLAREPEGFTEEVIDFLGRLPDHLLLDEGKLIVAHAGMKECLQGRASGKVWSFALFGETTGEVDEHGLPVRLDWAANYRGEAMVVYGHTPVREARWVNHTINLDTGCVFGGKLTALRYPEGELLSVRARRCYVEPPRPL